MIDESMQAGLARVSTLLSQGDSATAWRMASMLTARDAHQPQAWFLLGVAHHLQGRRQEALTCFERTLELAPAHLQALRAKAAVLSELGNHAAALQVCTDTLSLQPDDPDLLANLGAALEKLERWEEALQHYERALAIAPDQLIALLNRGAVLMRLGRMQEALSSNRALVARHPAFNDAYYNLSETLLALHEYEEALSVCEAGLAQFPRHARLRLNRGVALAALSRFEEAQSDLAAAQTLDPDLLSKLLPDLAHKPLPMDAYASAEAIYAESGASAMKACDWRRRDLFVQTLRRFLAQGTPSGIALHARLLAFNILSLPLTAAQRLDLTRQIAEYVSDSAWLLGMPPFMHMPQTDGRIRIGYVSPDFRDHPVGHLSRQIYRLHDRARFEIHGYSITSAEHDPLQASIRADCDHWHDISSLGITEAARRIHEDGIHILVDLAGYTTHARTELFELRPAPIQAHYLGFPGTMGAEFIDYAVLDATVCPAGQEAHLKEQPVRLPHAYCPYDTATPNDRRPRNRAAYSLPEHGFVFCAFSAPYKIDPCVFDIWMRLLRETEGSVLWLASRQPTDALNLKREAAGRDVNPERLIFAPHLPREQHLPRFQQADLFLDTFWHNAHTMAADALWQGLPVLTYAGDAWSSRLAASLLHALDMPELITPTPDAYARQALTLAHDARALQALREKLCAARAQAPLFDTPRTVRHLEQAYTEMWRRYCAGEPPGPIDILPG